MKKKTETSTSVARQKPKGSVGGMGILLPPPPGSKTAQQTVPTVNTASNIFTSFESSTHSPFQSVTSTNATKTADNLLLDFD